MMSAIEKLEERLSKKWNAISAARLRTEDVVARLGSALSDLEDANFSVVVTGSLGRGEVTEGSDADWVLLVDGPSDPSHAIMLRDIAQRVQSVVPKEPGRTGTFGSIVASHELVHYIAGTRDSNENLTRRVLLLSESRALTNALVRERVIRNILARYVVHDRPVPSRSGRHQPIPHFLLNDLVRYWRTIASDYASKMWERQHEGWAIRNVKLRFSRKVLFLWGLLAAFSGELFPSDDLQLVQNEQDYYHMLAEHIRAQTDVPPLELIARAVLQCDDSNDLADAIFSPYDDFLAALSNKQHRAVLEKVAFEDALEAPEYEALRESSKRFREGITALFFDRHPKLPRLIREFGVF